MCECVRKESDKRGVVCLSDEGGKCMRGRMMREEHCEGERREKGEIGLEE